MTPARVRAIVAGGLAVVAALASAAPAVAAPPTITFISPPPAPDRVPRSDVTISATVEAEPREHLRDDITLTVDQVDPDRPDITASTPADGSSQTVSFPVDLPYNGEYIATITATASLLPVNKDTKSESRKFFVAAPPAVPTGVKTEVDPESRAVTVTWKANREPDMLFYLVQRAAGASTEFVRVSGEVAHPETKFVDTSTAAAGGEYRYQVVAMRKGVTNAEGINSDPSAISPASTATVPAPPAGTTAGTTAAGSAPASTAAASATPGSTLPAGSPGALTTSGTVDLRGFTSVQSAAQRPRRTIPQRDTGFQSTLPFAPQSPADGDGEEGEEEVAEVAAEGSQFRELGATEEGADLQRTMAFLAGGLLATVLLMHLLWVRSEVKRVPLEALAPQGPGGTRADGEPPDDMGGWFVPGRLGSDEAPSRVSQGLGGRGKVSAGS